MSFNQSHNPNISKDPSQEASHSDTVAVNDLLLSLRTNVSETRGQIHYLSKVTHRGNAHEIEKYLNSSKALIEKTRATLDRWKHSAHQGDHNDKQSRTYILESQFEATFLNEVNRYHELVQSVRSTCPISICTPTNLSTRDMPIWDQSSQMEAMSPNVSSQSDTLGQFDYSVSPQIVAVTKENTHPHIALYPNYYPSSGPCLANQSEDDSSKLIMAAHQSLSGQHLAGHQQMLLASSQSTNQFSLSQSPQVPCSMDTVHGPSSNWKSVGAEHELSSAYPQKLSFEHSQQNCTPTSPPSIFSPQNSRDGSGNKCYLSGTDTFSQSTTATGTQVTLTKQDESGGLTRSALLEDDFLRNDYSMDEDDDDDEFVRLLQQPTSPYMEGWNPTTQKTQPLSLQTYINSERFYGMQNIRDQAHQLYQVFQDFNHLLRQQQKDIDLFDSTLVQIGGNTMSAVDELRRANQRKQSVRRRQIVCVSSTLCVFILIYLVLSLPSTAARALKLH